ncbi:outer membrane beta-barrel family protein [Massilia sp. S19_KUP03_FR1]|uniref:outer membrane beta-barrel family protein n=1 Tax=Massilia sp. S19_KUP03_FR1 TaxID=3025503 RepID=UPI002FCDB3BC
MKTAPAIPAVTVTADRPVPAVNVVAERPTNRIDRQVYDVKSDISSTNGTASDALNNVPSVNVDPDGTVTLRGSSNVQILVDGKPSAMMQGDNRGASLNAMAADDIESVEVINNPGAQFGNEAGGGPILNLVMRRNRKAGGFATVNANAGTAGRYNSAASGNYNQGAWGFQGGLNVRHDGRNSTGELDRETLDPVSGAMLHSTQQSRATGLNDSVGANGTVNYNLNATDTLAASLNYNGRGNDQRSLDRYTNDDAAGTTIGDYTRSTRREGDSKNYAWGARYDHKGALPGETLKIDLRVSATNNTSDSDYANTYLVGAGVGNRGNSIAAQHSANSNHIVDFTGDYERPLGGGTAKLGYKIATNKSDVDTVYNDLDLVTLAPTRNAQRSNAYDMEENVAALYGSYQIKLNERWGALVGLRTEYTDLDIHQLTGNVEAKNSYVNFMPSAFATYKVSDESNLRFSYAHRLRRPNANDLNPYVIYRDEFNVFSGNPKLKPTQTDSVEVGYETKLAGLETNLRGYYRRDKDAIVDYRYFIADNVLLTTRQNGQGSNAGGLEFTVNGKVAPWLTINTSGNLARSTQRSQDTNGVFTTRTANSLSGRARLNIAFNQATQVQLALQMMGKQLSGQGYRSPNRTLNVSLRHVLTPELTLVANVTDVFNSNKMETVVDSVTLQETSTRKFDGRVFYVGLSYRFGGATSKASQEGEGMRFRGRGEGGPPGGGPGGPPGGGGPEG